MAASGGAYAAQLPAVPEWLNKGDNAWQLTAATLVGIQSMPGLVVLYGSIVKKKWAVNSAFMALYAYASSLLVWVLVGFRMAFGERLLPFWGKAGVALSQEYLVRRASLSATAHGATAKTEPFYPEATLVMFQFEFAAITLVLLAGSVLGRMNIKAWMAFTPLWLLLSYTVGAFSLWGGGFLYHWGVIDYSGGYVIHLSSGVAGFTAAYWVRPYSTYVCLAFNQSIPRIPLRLRSHHRVFAGMVTSLGPGPACRRRGCLNNVFGRRRLHHASLTQQPVWIPRGDARSCGNARTGAHRIIDSRLLNQQRV
jgi:ammonia channel protein AmtB